MWTAKKGKKRRKETWAGGEDAFSTVIYLEKCKALLVRGRSQELVGPRRHIWHGVSVLREKN